MDPDDDTNPADEVVDYRTAIDDLEPLEVAASDLPIICEHFSKALVWASQAKSLVEMGWRIHTMLHLLQPALIEGMALERRVNYECELRISMECGPGMIKRVGEYYYELLAWLRRCNGLSQLGQRGFAAIYILRRDLIGRLNTNAALGGLSNKTRQAFNKTVCDLRDALRGFRNGVMRGETTRIRCRISQTSRN